MSDNPKPRAYRRIADDEKSSIVAAFLSSGMDQQSFADHAGISKTSLARWIKASKGEKPKGKGGGPHSPDQRRQAVEAFLASGLTLKDFAKT